MTSNVNTDTILKSILFLIFFSVFIYNLDRIFIEHKEIILLMLLMSCMQYLCMAGSILYYNKIIRETLVFFYILQYLQRPYAIKLKRQLVQVTLSK